MAECISSAAGTGCKPAEFEWQYMESEMHRPGEPPEKWDWIPLCGECCAYWRRQARLKPDQRPYRIRSIQSGTP